MFTNRRSFVRSSVMGVGLVVVISMAAGGEPRDTLRQDLREILGDIPESPQLHVEVVESIRLDTGWRHKIQYVVEDADPMFNRPQDLVRAFLFEPDHESGERLPAVVAMHQDGGLTHIGKREPAGLEGGVDQAYGLELFRRGNVVIVPDRFPHGERRRLSADEPTTSVMMRDLALWLRWSGQLILQGRTCIGKEVYDVMRAVDVLEALDYVDPDRIGAIGHSAGGNIVVYSMFADPRIRAGVSSCGFFELIDFFDDTGRSINNAVFALPGLARVGCSADYLALVAPRGVLLTRGLSETANEAESQKHAESSQRVETHARQTYEAAGASSKLSTIYFEGGHEFPPKIRDQAYEWLERMLQPGY